MKNCERHPDSPADLKCMECGHPFCRECVKDTGDANLCYACYRVQLERLASQLRPRKVKAGGKPGRLKMGRAKVAEAGAGASGKEPVPSVPEFDAGPDDFFIAPADEEPLAFVDDGRAGDEAGEPANGEVEAEAPAGGEPRGRRADRHAQKKVIKGRPKKGRRSPAKALRKPAVKPRAAAPPVLEPVTPQAPPGEETSAVPPAPGAAVTAPVPRAEPVAAPPGMEPPAEAMAPPGVAVTAPPSTEEAVPPATSVEVREAAPGLVEAGAPGVAPDTEQAREAYAPREKDEFWGEDARSAGRRKKKPARRAAKAQAEAAPPGGVLEDALPEAESPPDGLEGLQVETRPRRGKKERKAGRRAAAVVPEAAPPVGAPGAEPAGAEASSAEKDEFWGEDVPRAARRKAKAKRPAVPLAMQVPVEYRGEVTATPSYLKAVLWSLLAGALGACLYAGMAWWRNREFGILGWVIGVAVGLAVAFGSGRHFNWKLGLIAAFTAVFFLSAGRILVYMLDVWFPDIIKLPVSTWNNFDYAIRQFWRQLPTMWLLFLFMSGAAAFLLSFRPWPLKFQLPGGDPSGSEEELTGA